MATERTYIMIKCVRDDDDDATTTTTTTTAPRARDRVGARDALATRRRDDRDGAGRSDGLGDAIARVTVTRPGRRARRDANSTPIED
jgi:hypothetical protein